MRFVNVSGGERYIDRDSTETAHLSTGRLRRQRQPGVGVFPGRPVPRLLVCHLHAGGFLPRSSAMNDSVKPAPLNPAAVWLARRVVGTQRRASGHRIKSVARATGEFGHGRLKRGRTGLGKPLQIAS